MYSLVILPLAWTPIAVKEKRKSKTQHSTVQHSTLIHLQLILWWWWWWWWCIFNPYLLFAKRGPNRDKSSVCLLTWIQTTKISLLNLEGVKPLSRDLIYMKQISFFAFAINLKRNYMFKRCHIDDMVWCVRREAKCTTYFESNIVQRSLQNFINVNTPIGKIF